MIKLSLLVAGARAGAPPEVHEAIKAVVFSGGLANPLTEFEDARWEQLAEAKVADKKSCACIVA